MPRGSTYANNASNRSLGRVGMAMGSAPVSRTSGSSSSISRSSGSSRTYVDNAYNSNLGRVGMDHGTVVMSRNYGNSASGCSSGSAKTYVDNAYNRSLARVGMDHGTVVVSRNYSNSESSHSSGSNKTYADNAYNRNLGRVGMDHGTVVMSRNYGNSASGCSSGSAKTYVDNAYNRSLARVGMDRGTVVVSRNYSNSESSHSSGSNKTYADNAYNRNLGRVGMEHGSVVVSKSYGNSASGCSSGSAKTYVDNAYNHSLARVGMDHGSVVASRNHGNSASSLSSRSAKTYVDNAYNQSLGRVGKERGTVVVSRKNHSLVGQSQEKVYVDNKMNRNLGRVGKPVGSMPVSSQNVEKEYIKKAYNHHNNNPDAEFDDTCLPSGYETPCNVLENLREMFSRLETWQEAVESRTMMQRSESHDLHPTIPNNVPFDAFEGTVIDFNDLEIGKIIGHGGFGDVHVAKWNGKTVAVKKLRVQRVSRKRLTQFEEEVNLFCKLRHQNIIEFYGACITTPNLCMVMELMEGSLYDKLHVEEHQFEYQDQLFIANQISNGLVYLHSKGVAHCDIKSSNVLIEIFDVDKIHIKITDFGLSMMKCDVDSTLSSREKLVKEVGTPRYSAPEILRGEFLDRDGMTMADIYSFGLVMYEIFSGEEPFDEYNTHQLRKYVGNGDHMPDIVGLNLTHLLQSLIAQCCHRVPSIRPTAQECSSCLNDI